MIELIALILLFFAALFITNKWNLKQSLAERKVSINLKKDHYRNLKMGAILSMSFFLIAFNIESINGKVDETPDEIDTLMFIDHSITITRYID
jgi:hypothetical protein